MFPTGHRTVQAISHLILSRREKAKSGMTPLQEKNRRHLSQNLEWAARANRKRKALAEVRGKRRWRVSYAKPCFESQPAGETLLHYSTYPVPSSFLFCLPQVFLTRRVRASKLALLTSFPEQRTTQEFTSLRLGENFCAGHRLSVTGSRVFPISPPGIA